MLPNLIFLFNLLDVIPPDVQLYGEVPVAHKMSYVCDTFETRQGLHTAVTCSRCHTVFYSLPSIIRLYFAGLQISSKLLKKTKNKNRLI